MRDHLSPALAAELIAVAHALADAARAPTLAHFRTAIAADDKAAAGARYDPVTIADRDSEAAMRAILAVRRPQDAILGEEFGATPGSSGLTWVLDPIDGTRGYMSGTPTWGVLIGLSDAAGPIFGIIDQPYIRERFEGGLGRAQVTGPSGIRALAARPARRIDQAILLSTFPEIGTEAERRAFQAVARRVRLTRYGTDCYGYALVAAGQVDLVIEAGLHPYDLHGPIAVVQAAGGVVTDWQGGPAHDGGQVLAAANPQVHAAALALLQGADG